MHVSYFSALIAGVHGDVFMCEQMVFSTFLRLSPRSAIASICLFASKLDVHHLESVIVVPHSLLSRYSTSDQLVKTREFSSRKGTTGNLETRVSGLKLELTLRFLEMVIFLLHHFWILTNVTMGCTYSAWCVRHVSCQQVHIYIVSCCYQVPLIWSFSRRSFFHGVEKMDVVFPSK